MAKPLFSWCRHHFSWWSHHFSWLKPPFSFWPPATLPPGNAEVAPAEPRGTLPPERPGAYRAWGSARCSAGACALKWCFNMIWSHKKGLALSRLLIGDAMDGWFEVTTKMVVLYPKGNSGLISEWRCDGWLICWWWRTNKYYIGWFDMICVRHQNLPHNYIP